MKFHRLVFFLGAVQIIAGCGAIDDDDGASSSAPEQPLSTFFSSVSGVATYPEYNPYSPEKETLGELLFWDPILSGGMDVSCASCHHPDHQWADGRNFSIGVGGSGLGPQRVGESVTEFHSPSVLNSGLVGLVEDSASDDFVSGPYFWDAREETLEEQALEPIESAVEMRGTSYSEDEIFDEIVFRLSINGEYQALFQAAFGEGEVITPRNIAFALATFQRKLVTGRTRFDEYLDGDENALTEREVSGMNTFINAGCTDCHSGPMLSDFTIHADMPVIRSADAVKTPSLRQVSETGPYMHNGSRETLRRAISFYEERDDLGVTLGEDDFGVIQAFLMTLVDPDIYRDIPPAVPSGLPVGGYIINPPAN